MKSYTIQTRTFGSSEIDKGLTVVVRPGDVIKLPPRIAARVLAGKVWLTDRGRDILLERDGEHCCDSRNSAVMLSNISEQPATVRFTLSAAGGCEDFISD